MSSPEVNNNEAVSKETADKLPDRISNASSHSSTVSLSKGTDEKGERGTTAQDSAAVPQGFHPGWRFFVAFSSMSAVTLMVALDATSLGNALPVRHLCSPTSSPKS